MSKQKQKNIFCTQHIVNLYFAGNSMNNHLSYCGLTDSRMRASEKDLPVTYSSTNPKLIAPSNYQSNNVELLI